MYKAIATTIIVITYNCCTSKQNITTNQTCDQDRAKAVADKLFKKRKYIIENYDTKIIEDSSSFKIVYELSDKLAEGGGAEITISKRDCSIVDQKLYQ